MTTTPAPAVTLAPVPMPAEQAEAHLQRIEHLLADLEAAVGSLFAASWGERQETETARFLPDGTIKPLSQWLNRCDEKLCAVCEEADTFGWDL